MLLFLFSILRSVRIIKITEYFASPNHHLIFCYEKKWISICICNWLQYKTCQTSNSYPKFQDCSKHASLCWNKKCGKNLEIYSLFLYWKFLYLKIDKKENSGLATIGKYNILELSLVGHLTYRYIDGTYTDILICINIVLNFSKGVRKQLL